MAITTFSGVAPVASTDQYYAKQQALAGRLSQLSDSNSKPFGHDAEQAALGSITRRACMTIQVTPIENGYVIELSTDRGAPSRLIYATDLTDVGQQITAFAVSQALGCKDGKT